MVWTLWTYLGPADNPPQKLLFSVYYQDKRELWSPSTVELLSQLSYNLLNDLNVYSLGRSK